MPGIDQAHASLVQFNTPRGWLALLWATLLSGPSHANKLLAGYVAMRTLGLQAHFVDILREKRDFLSTNYETCTQEIENEGHRFGEDLSEADKKARDARGT